jgi:hypothetical protein
VSEVPEEVFTPLAHMALGYEIAVSEILDAPLVLDDTGTGTAGDVMDQAVR